MGEIWSAEYRRDGTRAAVKLMTSQRARDERFRQTFQREVRAVAGLDHPCIVMVYDYGEVTEAAASQSTGKLEFGTPFLVMEMVQGGSLHELRGQLDWPQLKKILVSLLGALAHAHSRGVIHRDIKPGNVLIREDESVKVTDFGLAHAMGVFPEEGDPAQRGGTPAYMAPEQLKGQWRNFGPWTDLYSVGCLTWSMVSGRPPFSGETWLDTVRGHLAEVPKPLRPKIAVPPELEEWLLRLLHKNPALRYRRAADAAWGLMQMSDPADLTVSMNDTPIPPQSTEGPRTTLQWSQGDLPRLSFTEPPAPVLDAERRPLHERAPIPPDWRQLEMRQSPLLSGVGLGLFGLRSIGMVGRENERELLWDSLKRVASSGGPELVAIQGPIGCGKSRLAQWLCERAHEVGTASTLSATHSPVLGTSDGIGQMLARYTGCVGLSPEETANRVRETVLDPSESDPYEVRALADLMTGSRYVRGLHHRSPKERYAVVERFLSLEAIERPMVLWLDDVQWGIDALSLCQYLMRPEARLPLVIVLTYRTNALSETHRAILDHLLAHERATRVEIEPLPSVYAAELTQNLLGLEPELAERIARRTEGNPLFAVELVGDWVRRDLLTPTPQGFVLRDGAQPRLPDDLHELGLSTLQSSLSLDVHQKTLELAAAFGLNVNVDEWRFACEDAGLSDPMPIAEEMVRTGLMRPLPAGWRFSHAVLRETLEQISQDAGRWESANLHCARAIRAVHPHAEQHSPGRIGTHLLRAGRIEVATSMLLEGAKQHIVASEFREALEQLDQREQALRSMGLPEGDSRLVRGWIARATTYLQQGRPQYALEWALKASRVTRKRSNKVLYAQAINRLGDVCRHRGESHQAQAHYLESLRHFSEAEDWSGIGQSLLGLGELAGQEGRYDRARELLQDARAALARAGDQALLARSLGALAKGHRQMGNLPTSRRLAVEALTIFEELGDANGQATALHQLSVIAMLLREFDEGEKQLRRALHLYEHTGNPLGQSACLNSLAELHRHQGNLDRAEIEYERAAYISKAAGSSEALIPSLNLSLVVLRRRRFGEARTLLSEIAAELETDNRRGLLGGAHIGLLACAAAAEDLTAVEEHFNQGRTLLAESGMVDPDVAWPAEMAGDLLSKIGAEDWARACFELSLTQWEALKREEDAERLRGRIKDVACP